MDNELHRQDSSKVYDYTEGVSSDYIYLSILSI